VGAGAMGKQPSIMTRRARSMRSEPTDAERRLWGRLKDRQINGWRFRRQHPIVPYVADFACVEARLIVEVDGGQHNDSRHDAIRDMRLRAEGWRVLRVWNNDVLSNTEGVVDVIATSLGPHPSPPPAEPGEGV
jgi:very-short-patch-repair endonuclease